MNDLWRFTPPIPPGAFELDTNATLPDTDGLFLLNWSESVGADTYSLYWSTTPDVDDSDILYIEDLINETMLIKGFSSGTYYFRKASNNKTGATRSKNELKITIEIPSLEIPSTSDEGGNGGNDGEDSAISGYNPIFLLGILCVVLMVLTKKYKNSIKNKN